MSALPRAARAIMASRVEPPDSLDFFPTPPWVTRALVHEVIGRPRPGEALSVWEPAAGEGHMAEVLRESFARVHASDIFDYGRGYAVGSFAGGAPNRAECPFKPDWIITNPPFAELGAAFAERANLEARVGVALFLQLRWAESVERWKLFQRWRPTTIAIFAERCALVRGRWDPNASSAAAYAWFVWRKPVGTRTLFEWIAPGAAKRHSRHDDIARFGCDEARERLPVADLFAASEATP